MVSKSSSTPRLVIIEGKEKGKIIPLKDGTVVIGRSKGDVMVHDPRISRSHVALHFEQKTGKLTYTDLKSLNGTIVNGESAETGELRDGDQLQLGNTLFDCHIAGAEETVANSEPVKITTRKKERHKNRQRDEKMEEPHSLEMSPAPDPDEPSIAMDDPHDNSYGKEPKRHSTGEIHPDAQNIPSLVKNFYLRLPKKARLAALTFGLIFLWMFFVKGGRPSLDVLDRETASIKMLESQGKLDEAVKKAESVESLFPENSQSYMVLGDLYGAQHKNEASIAAYRKAHDLKPLQSMVHIRLIKMYLRSGLVKEAEDELKHVDQIIKDGPHTKELFIEAAQLFLEFKELKQPPEKTYILAKALQNQIAPESAIGYKLEAQLLLQQSKNQEALEVLERGLRFEPRDEWLMENIAFAKLSLHDVAGAMQVVEGWIQFQPNATKALLVMAYLKFNEKNYLAALPHLQKILQVLANTPTEPHYAEALHLMGQIYYQQNQLQEASNFLKQACDLGFQESCSHALLKDGANKSPASLPPSGK